MNKNSLNQSQLIFNNSIDLENKGDSKLKMIK